MSKNIKELNPHCITAVLEPHLTDLYNSTSKEVLYTKVRSILAENQIDTPASRRLLIKLQTSKNISNSMFIISNSILSGNGLSVI